MWTIGDIVTATKGFLAQGRVSARCRGISIDSRTLRKGDAFLAIKGGNFDGHAFIRTALRKGAGALIVSRKVKNSPPGIPVILVAETTRALGDIAAFHRRRFSIPVVAVTGSTGKTTTKDLIAHLLSRKFNVLKNEKSYNNFIGVPLTLLRLTPAYDVAVVELGTSFPGEIAYLTGLTRPGVAVMTNIAASHTEFLKTPSCVFKEKFALVARMPGRGVVIFNQDDFFLKKIPRKNLRHRLVAYGIQSPCRYQARDVVLEGRGRLRFSLGKKETVMLKTPYLHNVANTLAAISCARLFAVAQDDIRRALKKFSFPSGRGILEKRGPYWVIDDTYNSNPLSLKGALASFSAFETKNRKILVCGDMLELGKQSQRYHRAVGRRVAESGIDVLLTVGRHSRLVTEEAKKDKNLLAYHCASLKIVQDKLKEHLHKGDVILVKGSRAMHLERIVELFKK